MKRVGFGFLGTTLDATGGFGEKRHSAWRPTVSLGLDPSLSLSRLELWCEARFMKLASTVKADIEGHRDDIQVVLRDAPIRNPWDFEEVYSFLYDFADHYAFDQNDEEYYVHLTTGTHVAQICLFLLTETRHFPAKLVQTSPRNSRGMSSLAIIDLDLTKYDTLAKRFERKLKDDLAILKTGIGTRNPSFNRMISEIEIVAKASKEPLLLLGPTGAGKSQLAKQIYLLKQSHHHLKGSFVDINCATIRGEQAMSTLFGHARGAFTGAATKRDGLLKKADHGLLFLDEIGELGLDEQAMLLRALEEKRFFPLGSDHEEQSDFQLISGTNKDLHIAVRQGTFREDLFHRINMWPFQLPALRERLEDIEPNLDYELRRFEEKTGRRITFSSEAKQHYLEFAAGPHGKWPGNFRDLNASVSRMATLAPQGRISVPVVMQEVARLTSMWQSAAAPSTDSHVEDTLLAAGVAVDQIDSFDRPQLAHVLQVLNSSPSIAEAGRLLFSVSRQSRRRINDSDRLRKYLARFGLDARTFIGR